jgi:fibronectin-binding autotransporter adhesin
LSASGALPSISSFVLDGGLNISSIAADQVSIKNLSGSNTGAVISLGSKTLSITQALDQTYQGSITGAGGIKKSGSAGLVLAGSLSYTGPTEVSAGILSLPVMLLWQALPRSR